MVFQIIFLLIFIGVLIVLLIVFDNKIIQISLVLCSTLLFLNLIFLNRSSIIFIFQYFLLQEFLGFHYLLRFFRLLQILILLIKGGYSPFFFWTLIFGEKLIGSVLSWFLTVQKLPTLILLLMLINNIFIYLFIMGLILVFLVYWLNYSFKFLLILSRVESLTWVFIMFFNNLLRVIIVFFYLLMVYFFSLRLINLDFILSLRRFPFSVPFILKILSINIILYFNIFQFILISIALFSILRMRLIILLFILKNIKNNINFFSFLIITFPLIFILSLDIVNKHTSLIRERFFWAKLKFIN